MDDRLPVEPSLEPADKEPAGDPDTLTGPPEGDRLPDGNLVGADNIRDGRVGGVIGGPHQQGGEGQGG